MHLSGIDLNLLPVLDALLSERSVTRAAKRVGLSQPAMSHALARLRTLLGDRLLVRTAGGMAPTPRAEALAEPVRAALAALSASLFEPPRFDPKTARRAFRIGSSDYAEFVLLPDLAARLSSVAPGIDLWVRPVGARPSLQLGEGDLELVIGPVPERDRLPGIHVEDLFTERFVCVVRRGHPLARGRLTVAKFAAARHAFIAPRGTPGGAVDDALAALGKTRRVAVAIPHFLVAPYVVAKSDLVLTIGERVARPMAKQLGLVILEPPLTVPGFTISLSWHERRAGDPGLGWLRGVISRAG